MTGVLYVVIFFFFKQKTAYDMRISDWSSDVCSSDLIGHHRIIHHRTFWRLAMISQVKGINMVVCRQGFGHIMPVVKQTKKSVQDDQRLARSRVFYIGSA